MSPGAELVSRCTDAAPAVERVLAGRSRRWRRERFWLAALAALAAAAFAAGLGYGPGGFDAGFVWRGFSGDDSAARSLVLGLRLPRLCMGALAGAGLALSGCLAQAALRNPLASPFTLGVSSGAAFGAALCMVLWPLAFAAVPLAALGGGLSTALAALGVSRLRDGAGQTLVLAGVAVMFLFSALTSFIQYTAPQMELQRIVFWTFGSLSKAGWSEIAAAALLVLGPAPWLAARAWDLNIALLGDETARSLGVAAPRLRGRAIVALSVMSAGAVCFCGVIGFIGLVAPHMARLAVGGDHRTLLPASAALGAALVLFADLLGRVLLAPLVIPVGIMTAFLGVPFFFWLIVRDSRRPW